MKDLQALINAKAEAIVKEKLENIKSFFLENINIFQFPDVFISVKGEQKNINDATWHVNTKFFGALREKLLEKEIEIQSKLFHDKVNQLHSEVTNLLGDYIQENNE